MEAYQAIAISLGLGLLAGLQLQLKYFEVAGIRTFPLITLLESLSVLYGDGQLNWLTATGLLSPALLMYASVERWVSLPVLPAAKYCSRTMACAKTAQERCG